MAAGRVNSVSMFMPRNASLPMLLTEAGSSSCRPAQPLNAELPIFSTVSGSTTFASTEQFWNVEAGISVIVAGRVADSSAWQFWNTLLPKLFTELPKLMLFRAVQ